MKIKQHSLDPVREALREFEEAVRVHQKKLLGSDVLQRQDVARARERVMESIMTLVRETIAEREGTK